MRRRVHPGTAVKGSDGALSRRYSGLLCRLTPAATVGDLYINRIAGVGMHDVLMWGSYEAVAAIKRGMQEATTERAFTVPAALRAQIREASEVAFGIGVGRCFLVAVIACVLCAVLVWVGAHRHAQDVSDSPQRAT